MQRKKNDRPKVYITIVLGVLFCVVGYFRFFYRGPEGTAGSAPVGAAGAALPVVPALSLPSPGVPLQEPSVRETMREVERDIFEPGKSARVNETKSKASADAAPEPLQLTLNGMVYSSRKPIAIINGKFMRIGDRVGNYRIMQIGPKEVRLQGEDREIILGTIDHAKN